MDSALFEFFKDQGSIIAGVLALIAGILAYRAGRIQATETRLAAIMQVAPAQHQTAVTREIERRRIAREGYAFHAMLEAAMGAVIEDVEAARKLPPPSSSSRDNMYSAQAYPERQRVKGAGFAELRNAFLRFGGPKTPQFLQLDKEIEDLAAQAMTTYNSADGFPIPIGVNAAFSEQLDRIEQQAIVLRDHAVGGMKLCRDELAKELVSLET